MYRWPLLVVLGCTALVYGGEDNEAVSREISEATTEYCKNNSSLQKQSLAERLDLQEKIIFHGTSFIGSYVTHRALNKLQWTISPDPLLGMGAVLLGGAAYWCRNFGYGRVSDAVTIASKEGRDIFDKNPTDLDKAKETIHGATVWRRMKSFQDGYRTLKALDAKILVGERVDTMKSYAEIGLGTYAAAIVLNSVATAINPFGSIVLNYLAPGIGAYPFAHFSAIYAINACGMGVLNNGLYALFCSTKVQKKRR